MKFKSKIFIVALFFCLIMSLGFVAAQDNTTLNANDVKVNDYKEDAVKISEENTNDLSSNSNNNDNNKYNEDLISNSNDQEENLKDSEKTFTDVQAAIDAAKPGETIYLNGTTYNWSKTIKITKSNLTIDGGFADRAGVSILDGNGAGQMIMQISGNNIVIKNIKFMNGGRTHMLVNGGAIQWTKNTQNATVSDCEFINNSANAGGAINYQCVNMNISNCIFENNTGVMMSGAIMAGQNSVATISNCTFRRNRANVGGAISGVSSKELNVENCSFIDNNAIDGGAISVQKAGLDLSDSVFENNSAEKRGGAITSGQSLDVNSTIANCSFSENNATDGGAVIVHQSNLVIDNSTFSNNSAVCGGGLVVEGTSTVNITQSEFVGNEGNIVYNSTNDTINVDNATEEASDDDLIQVMPDMSKINITIDNYTYGEKGTIDCVITDSAYYDSSIYVIINDEIYSALIDSEGKATIELPSFNAGLNFLDVIYNGTGNYSRAHVLLNFTVYKKAIDMAVNTTNITIGDTAFFDVVLNETIGGIAYIVYGGQNYTTNLTLGSGTIEIPNLDVGNYTFEVFYDAENYNASSVLVNLTVSKNIVNMTANAENITIGDIARINVVLNPAINCVVYTIYGGKEYNTTIAGGRGTIEIPDLELGNYTLTVIYDGSDEYEAVNTTVDFSVKEAIGMNVTADNITYGDPAFINVVLNYDDAEGTVCILYKGTYYTANLTSGRGTIKIPNLNGGNHSLDVIYSGCEKYNATSAVVNLTVYKNAVTMIADADDITYGASALIKVYLTPNDAEGVVYIVYGGRNYTANLTGGRGTIEIPDLNAGNYTFDVIYSGCENYNASSTVVNLSVSKRIVNMTTDADNITVGDIAQINVVLNPAIDGVVYIVYGGRNYTADITSGRGTIEIPDLDAGDYTFTVSYDGSLNYEASSTVVNLTVFKKDANIIVNAENITYGDIAQINVDLGSDAEGVVYIFYGGRNYTANLTGGRGTIEIPDLTAGNYNFTVSYDGSEIYNNGSASFNLTVYKHNSTIDVNVTDIVYGETLSIFISTDCPDSEVYVDINGQIYSTTLVGGQGVINIRGLDVNNYLVNVTYDGTPDYHPCVVPVSFNVVKANATVNVSAVDVVYGENALINVSTDCEDSVAYVEINGVTYAVNLVDGRGVINITNLLNIGYYNLNVIYNGTAHYNPCVVPVSFNVVKANATVNVSAVDVVYGENALINVSTDCEDSVAYVEINGVTYAVNLVDGHGVINITDILNAGLYDLNVTYNGTDNYNVCVVPVSFNVVKANSTVNVSVSDVVYGENVLINVSTDCEDSVAFVEVNGVTYAVDLVDGRGVINVTDILNAGLYDLNVTYNGSANYNVCVVPVSFNVNKANSTINVSAADVVYGENVLITVSTDCEDSVAFVDIDGVTYAVNLVDGHGVINITDILNAGLYDLNVTYNGTDNYNVCVVPVSFNVNKANSTINVSAADVVYGENVLITVSTDCEDSVSFVDIDGVIYAVDLVDGHGVINITDILNAGLYDLNVTYNGSANYNVCVVPVSFNVNKANSTINVSAADVVYGENVLITVSTDCEDSVAFVDIDGVIYAVNLVDGHGVINITDLLNVGYYNLNVIYNGSANYNPCVAPVSFNVIKADSTINVSADDAIYGENALINISTDCEDSVAYTMVNGVIYAVDLVDGHGVINITGLLTVGYYHLYVIYNGSANYNPCVAQLSFNVIKANSTINVSATDVVYGENALINVSTDCEDSIAFVVVNGVPYAINLVDGHGVINVTSILNAGNYSFNVTYMGTPNYNACVVPVSFNVVKANSTINVSAANVVYGGNPLITVSTNCEDSVAFVEIDGVTYAVDLVNGRGVINVTDILNVGYYNLNVIYNGTANYNPCVVPVSFNVIKADSTMNVSADTIVYGDNVLINVSTDCEDSVVFVEIYDVIYAVNLVDGRGVINVTDILSVGYYTFNVIYNGSANYDVCVVPVYINVIKANSTMNVSADTIVYGGNVLINVSTDCGDSVAFVVIDGVTYAVDLVDGRGVINVTDILNVGYYNLNVIYNGSANYNPCVAPVSFNIIKANSTIDVSAADVVYGENILINVTTDCEDGMVYAQVNGNIYAVNLVDGRGVINITSILNVGLYELNVTYSGTENYNASVKSVSFNVTKQSTSITAKNATFVINYGGSYQITLNNRVANVPVKFTLNGKVIGTVKTDASGKAKITLTPAQLKKATAGKRNLIISFDGDQNHNPSKTTVKIIIDKEITKFTNVKSVKSSYKSTDKTMQLTATLKDSKNKVIKNQYVTFKVNNKKTFKVKTNSKGVALLTLNAANIKACNLNKPGNYKFTVTYDATATYSKTTGNATVKVL